MMNEIQNLPVGRSLLLAGGWVKVTHEVDGWYVQDLDSEHGTFLNGEEVYGRVLLKNGDQLTNGDFSLTISELTQNAWLPAPVFDSGEAPPVLAMSRGIQTVRDGKGKRNILNDVSFVARRGEFIGILGSSGSGKSTLLKAVAGMNRLTEGTVQRNGCQMTADELLNDQRIAYLPQDVVIHEVLTPKAALGYIAELKKIALTPNERSAAIQAVLERVGMWEHAQTPIQRLSGGQRKRVALAAELLGNPEILLLDEATSGLDPATEREMMELFRSLAEEGKTVLCVTHFAGRLFQCDRLLYMMKGELIFNGTPHEYQNFFGSQDLEEAYTIQNTQAPEEWKARFAEMFGKRDENPLVYPSKPETPAKPVDWVGQWFLLLKRYCRIQFSDWKTMLLLFLQAPVIALMVGLAFGDIRADFAELHASRIKEVVFTLILATLWCSGTASIREIVKEKAIFLHEIRFGLDVKAYLLSKFVFLAVFSVVQTFCLLYIVQKVTCLTGGSFSQFMLLAVTGVTGTAIGLILSSVSSNCERAMTFLPVVLIAQAIFSGGLATLKGMVLWCARLLVPAYWALEGLRSTFSPEIRMAQYPGTPGEYQYPILGSGVSVWVSLFVLLLMAFLLLLGAWGVLAPPSDAPSVLLRNAVFKKRPAAQSANPENEQTV